MPLRLWVPVLPIEPNGCEYYRYYYLCLIIVGITIYAFKIMGIDNYAP